ncbi:hypothetical protein D3C84_674160 [compost metagenome]
MILFFLTLPTIGIILIIYWFMYNKIYTNDLIEKGFKAVMTKHEAEFMSAKIGVHRPIVSSSAGPTNKPQESHVQSNNELAN